MTKVDPKFIVKLQGKEFILYAGLVEMAHQAGLISLEVELIQTPDKSNDMTAICTATAKTKEGIFTDIGDASPGSVNRMIAPHIIRMAATRAKARALRDLTNVGMTAVEEMMDEEVPDKKPYSTPQANANKPQANAAPPDPSDLFCSDCNVAIEEKVRSYSQFKFKKPLCYDCQKKQ